MFDHFLTTILQTILIFDVLAIAAYFVLGGLKRRTQIDSGRPLFGNLGHSLFERWPWSREAAVPARAVDFADLRNVLYSFREGLT
jgi:hypothetical protein